MSPEWQPEQQRDSALFVVYSVLLIKDSKIDMPKALIENELDKMEGQFKGDIANMGLQPEDYLKHIKKTWEDLRKEWKPDAEKRSKTQLILLTETQFR